MALVFLGMDLLLFWWHENSPQAIFKDPFRRGNNILVSPFHLSNKICSIHSLIFLQNLISVYLLQIYRWCVMLTPQLESQSQLTRDTAQLRFSAILMLLLRCPGTYLFNPCLCFSKLFFRYSLFNFNSWVFFFVFIFLRDFGGFYHNSFEII